MDDLNNTTKESNDEIHIDVEENVKKVEPSKEDAEESDSQSLESYLEEEIKALPNEECYFGLIYKVSEKYRKVKEESYTPLVVSIGPLHHGKSYLQPMEAYKLKCLNNLRNLYGISLKKLSEYATAEEDEVRSYYQDFSFSVKDFSKMILLDGIFIILLIAKDKERFREVGDPVILDRQKSWRASDIMHDMLLLENQLPLYFIEGLLKILDDDQQKESSDSILEDLQDYFGEVGVTSRLTNGLESIDSKCTLHLVHFLLVLHQPTYTKQPSDTRQPSETEHVKILNLKAEYTRSTSELQEAGVRFYSVNTGGLFEVSFNKLTGELHIPKLTVNDTTETFFRNLIAFEQCGYTEKHITSYVIFMDNLINTAKDVKFLVDHEIIVNLLGEDQLVADLFNNLHKEVIEDGKDFYFDETCNDLNKYSKDWFHQWRSRCFKWKLILKKNYFSNPWSVISFIAATIVVALTIVQTGFAIAGPK